MAKPLKPAISQWFSRAWRQEKIVHLHGPTWNLAWNDATLAKQHIARKLKNICDAKKMMAGFETIIYNTRQCTR